MDMEAASTRNSVARSKPRAGLQLSLPLEADSRNEYALRAAWARSGLQMPFHVAMRNRPIAACLRGLAEAMRRKACRAGSEPRPESRHETNSNAIEPAVAESYG